MVIDCFWSDYPFIPHIPQVIIFSLPNQLHWNWSLPFRQLNAIVTNEAIAQIRQLRSFLEYSFWEAALLWFPRLKNKPSFCFHLVATIVRLHYRIFIFFLTSLKRKTIIVSNLWIYISICCFDYRSILIQDEKHPHLAAQCQFFCPVATVKE